jgi:hypothetical protein
VACYLLDDAAGTDGSQNDLHAEVVVGVTSEIGQAGQAAVFENDDRMGLPDDLAFDLVQAVTVEAWIRPDAFADPDLSSDPAKPRAAVFDHNNAYSIFIDDAGRVFCNGGGVMLAPAGQLTPGRWSHVACAIAEGFEKVVYVDGDVVASGPAGAVAAGGPPEIASDAPFTENDSHFVGAIDNLLIWSVARTRAEICQTAGLSCE